MPFCQQPQVVRIRRQNDRRRSSDRDGCDDRVDRQITLLPAGAPGPLTKSAGLRSEVQSDRLWNQPLHYSIDAGVRLPAGDDLGRHDSRQNHSLTIATSRREALTHVTIVPTSAGQAFRVEDDDPERWAAHRISSA